MTDLSTTLSTVLGTAYRLERELGGGGMSRVFLAEETALGRRVVIRVLPPYGALVTTLAATGRVADARRVLTEWTASMPSELSRVQGWSIATARGEVLLAEKNGAGALAAFRAGDSISCVPCAWPNYARAYDVMGKRDSAIFWYEKYLSSSSVLLSNAAHARLLAQAYKRLGELHEDAGHNKEALQRYSDFVALWKNADATLQPAVKSAKERMARLQAKRN